MLFSSEFPKQVRPAHSSFCFVISELNYENMVKIIKPQTWICVVN
uniref:Uncharacterized protein n=1 Tax=Anguilla anguilla TaxID=7936 RepID=A0A0E9WAD0_ANGAN